MQLTELQFAALRGLASPNPDDEPTPMQRTVDALFRRGLIESVQANRKDFGGRAGAALNTFTGERWVLTEAGRRMLAERDTPLL